MTEFGYNGLPDNNWWTQTFGNTLKRHRLAYVMAWRNAGEKPGGQHEFYVPYKGQGSAPDNGKVPILTYEITTTRFCHYPRLPGHHGGHWLDVA